MTLGSLVGAEELRVLLRMCGCPGAPLVSVRLCELNVTVGKRGKSRSAVGIPHSLFPKYGYKDLQEKGPIRFPNPFQLVSPVAPTLFHSRPFQQLLGTAFTFKMRWLTAFRWAGGVWHRRGPELTLG